MMSRIDSAAFDDMLTVQDITRVKSSADVINKNRENAKERNAGKNYGKNQKTSTVLTDKKKCKKKK